jgi:hypothetical protein
MMGACEVFDHLLDVAHEESCKISGIFLGSNERGVRIGLPGRFKNLLQDVVDLAGRLAILFNYPEKNTRCRKGYQVECTSLYGCQQ